MSRIGELVSKWDDDGATRGASYIELRDAALAVEYQLEAAKQRELELLAVIDSLPIAIRNIDFTALREHEAKVLEEAADWFEDREIPAAPEALRRLAEERRTK